jgi:ElaA protein
MSLLCLYGKYLFSLPMRTKMQNKTRTAMPVTVCTIALLFINQQSIVFMQLQWRCKSFETLTNSELYTLLRLRSEVFVVEQNCVFLDMDNKDQTCHHLLGYDGETLVAAARLLGPNTAYQQISIGRVVSNSAYRGTGAGKLLMQAAINQCYQLFGNGDIKIGAQLYLKKFYESFGFTQTSDIYDEDGIDHLEMVKKP